MTRSNGKTREEVGQVIEDMVEQSLEQTRPAEVLSIWAGRSPFPKRSRTDEVQAAYNSLDRNDWNYFDGRLRFTTGADAPMVVIDKLNARDSEGNSHLVAWLESYDLEVQAEALDHFLHLHTPDRRGCRQAVAIAKAELMLRNEALKAQGLDHDVMCCLSITYDPNNVYKPVYRPGCKASMFSTYHMYICGDEDTISPENLEAYDIARVVLGDDDGDVPF